jgi:hypothetical protein
MKKTTLCIGAFLVLFLMFGVYTAQAQADLRAFDGKWVKGTLSTKNGYTATSLAPEKIANTKKQFYACMMVDPANADRISLSLYDKNGVYQNIGGYIDWQAGDNNDFVGLLFLAELGSGENTAYVNAINGRFKSINGYGIYTTVGRFSTWDVLFSGKITESVPSGVAAVPCGY